MGKTYQMTTPLMGKNNKQDNEHIRAFQRALISRGYYHGAVDGLYGLGTANAVFNFKYHFGYLKADHNAGDLVYSYLTGGKKQSTAMKLLAARRNKKIQKAITLSDKVVTFYDSHVGQKEFPPNSNNSFVTKWYGESGPWCAMTFVMAYALSGSKYVTKATAWKHNWAYVPNIVHDARNGLNGLTAVSFAMVRPGDGVAFDWPGESPGIADHIGIFEKWVDKNHGIFYSLEGNTSVGNDSNGGELMRRERYTNQVQCVIRVRG